MSTWKARERATARVLGGKRIPVTGERHGADAENAVLCIQHKHGRNRPGYLKEWLQGIRGNAQPKDKTGIVVWSVKHERQSDAIVLISLADFEALFGKVPESVAVSRAKEPRPMSYIKLSTHAESRGSAGRIPDTAQVSRASTDESRRSDERADAWATAPLPPEPDAP